MDPWLIALIVFVVLVLLSSLRVIVEYERGVKFTLGKFTSIMMPGLNIVVPIIQTYQKVDMRVRVVDVPNQESITKDNITVTINAVLYYRVSDSKAAVLKVEHYDYAIGQLAQTTMRNIVGEVELDQLLSSREEIAQKIRKIVDDTSDPWGIKVEAVDLKDITLPADMKRVIAKQAEAERERRAVIIKAEGEMMAAKNMASAAKTLATSEGALHLRTLQTLKDMSTDPSNTFVVALPLEILKAFGKDGKK